MILEKREKSIAIEITKKMSKRVWTKSLIFI